jgi:hypothetical protein
MPSWPAALRTRCRALSTALGIDVDVGGAEI